MCGVITLNYLALKKIGINNFQKNMEKFMNKKLITTVLSVILLVGCGKTTDEKHVELDYNKEIIGDWHFMDDEEFLFSFYEFRDYLILSEKQDNGEYGNTESHAYTISNEKIFFYLFDKGEIALTLEFTYEPYNDFKALIISHIFGTYSDGRDGVDIMGEGKIMVKKKGLIVNKPSYLIQRLERFGKDN